MIDRIELAELQNKEVSNDDILDDLKKALNLIRPNLEKVDKSIYPKVDRGLLPKIDIEQSNIKYPTYSDILNKEK